MFVNADEKIDRNGEIGSGFEHVDGVERADQQQDTCGEEKNSGKGAESSDDEGLGLAVQDAPINKFLSATGSFERTEDNCEQRSW